MMNTTALILFVLISIVGVTVDAFPTGAGACELGKASPGDPHTSAGRRPQTGPLAGAGFIVKIGDQTLDVGTPITVQAYEDIRVVVTSVGGEQPFRGAMVIASKAGLDTAGTFSLTTEDATKLQISPLCVTKAADGVTHVDNELKTSVEAMMRFDDNIQELQLDVNVVVINKVLSQGGSFYYYSQYKINVQGATPPPTPTSIRKCGLFGLGFFCPFSACGFFGRLIYGDDFC
jgi:hypothetical protein